MNKDLKFRNPALREAAVETATTVAALTARLDAISADIRELERWLQEGDLCIPVSHIIEGTGLTYTEPDEQGTSYGFLTPTVESLDWSEHQGRWRLVYTKQDLTEVVTRGAQIVEQRPLIETGAATRMRCDEHLPKFLNTVASKIPTEKRAPLNLNN